jgi:hypothetical protein
MRERSEDPPKYEPAEKHASTEYVYSSVDT